MIEYFKCVVRVDRIDRQMGKWLWGQEAKGEKPKVEAIALDLRHLEKLMILQDYITLLNSAALEKSKEREVERYLTNIDSAVV